MGSRFNSRGTVAMTQRFLSDSDPAYRELEERQRRLLSSTPFRVGTLRSFEDIRSSLNSLYTDNSFEFSGGPAKAERVKEDLELQFAQPFSTRYETVDYYVQLTWTDLLIRSFLATTDPRSDLKLTHSPLLGTLPSPALNAFTFSAAESAKSFVVLNWGVFGVLIDMTELAFETMRIEIDPGGASISIVGGEQEFRQRLNAQPQITEKLMNLLIFYYGNGKSDPRSSQPSQALFWFGSISRAMALFVLAHEYGHILAHHGSVASIASSDHDSESLVRSWAQELEADVIGFTLLSHVLRRAASEVPRQRVLLGFHLVAPVLYFECVRIVEEAEYIIKHGGQLPSRPSFLEISEARVTLDLVLKSMAGTSWRDPGVITAFSRYSDYPPAWLRWELASKRLEQERPGIPDRMQQGLMGTALALGGNLHALWDETHHKFAELVKEQAP
jgi:hypothetical protein